MERAGNECLEGAKNVLYECLNAQPDEKVLIVRSPPSISIPGLMTASSILWWCRVADSLNLNCERALSNLMRDRLIIEDALRKAAEERGCVTFLKTIDTSKLLDEHFFWKNKNSAKKLLSTMGLADVIIDLTLFGLDQLPPSKRSRDPLFSLRDEARKHSEARGVDLHLASRSSFTKGGAMCFNLGSIIKELKLFKEIIQKSPYLTLKSDGTDLRLNIHEDKVDSGTGIIHKPKGWHFLPSGVIFAPVRVVGTWGSVTLDGPIYGLGSISDYPLQLKIPPGTGRIEEDLQFADNTPTHIKELITEMFKIRECGHIAEVVIGFNSCARKNSVEPMEFYVARGNVTIALGRNDHIGGEISPTDPTKPSVHIHASVSNPTLTLSNGTEIVRRGKIVGLGKEKR